MLGTILWYIPRIFTFNFLVITFISGALCYFFLQKPLKNEYPTEAKIAKYGGLIYMIGGPLIFFTVKLIF